MGVTIDWTGIDRIFEDARGRGADVLLETEGSEMLRALGVHTVDLITNNPLKVKGLEEAGVRVRRRIPLPSPANPHNVNYLRVKRDRTGHLIQTDDEVAKAG